MEAEILHFPGGVFHDKEPCLDAYSRDAILRVFKDLRGDGRAKGLSDETLLRVLPELITTMLREAATSQELSYYIILHQERVILERLGRIEKRDGLDGKDVLEVAKTYLRRERDRALAQYALKLAGGDGHEARLFPYLPPGMRRCP